MNMKEMKTENGTEKKEDRRVRRTKKLLSQGLIELMQHKQVKDITVRELAERVDVNRGTFYLYYRDIFDLLERLEEDLFEQLNEVILAHKGEPVLAHIRPMLTDVFHIVAENKEICRVLLSDIRIPLCVRCAWLCRPAQNVASPGLRRIRREHGGFSRLPDSTGNYERYSESEMKRHERAQNQRRAKQTIKRETSGIRIGLNGFRLFCYIPA